MACSKMSLLFTTSAIDFISVSPTRAGAGRGTGQRGDPPVSEAEQEQAGRVRQARGRIDPVHAIDRLAVGASRHQPARLAAAEAGDSGEKRPDLRRVPFATRKTRSFPAGSLLAGARTPYSG